MFLIAFSIWKIERILAEPFRFRTNCDLKCVGVYAERPDGDNTDPLPLPGIKNKQLHNERQIRQESRDEDLLESNGNLQGQ